MFGLPKFGDGIGLHRISRFMGLHAIDRDTLRNLGVMERQTRPDERGELARHELVGGKAHRGGERQQDGGGEDRPTGPHDQEHADEPGGEQRAADVKRSLG